MRNALFRIAVIDRKFAVVPMENKPVDDKSEDDKPLDGRAACRDGSDAVMVYTTWPDADTAAVAAEALVGAGLAACANIFPAMTSVFVWESRLQRETEVAMILKTRRARIDGLMEEIRRRHPYDTPAILVIDVAGGSKAFLAWIDRQTVNST